MKSFVLVYERPTGKLTSTEFPAGHRGEAFALRSKLQRTAGPETEVVVFHADDLQELRSTHQRYFASVGEMIAKQHA